MDIEVVREGPGQDYIKDQRYGDEYSFGVPHSSGEHLFMANGESFDFIWKAILNESFQGFGVYKKNLW